MISISDLRQMGKDELIDYCRELQLKDLELRKKQYRVYEMIRKAMRGEDE